MDKKTIKKYIYWGIFIVFVIGSILAGDPFRFIDMIIVRPIVNLLFVIFNLVHDFGLAIIILTIIVKLCMWPIMKKQLNQSKLIRKLQPELVQIKKNCKGNKQLESLQTMDLYKRYNVKPFASMLTLLIQLPIFIAIFSAIKVVATPSPQDNLMNRAYDIVAYEGSEIQKLEEKQKVYLEAWINTETPVEEKTAYDFHPQLFGTINLDVQASNVVDIVMGRKEFSWSVIFILGCTIMASVIQYWATKQQMPSGKSEKKKKFRDILREAKEGKEIDESEISTMATGSMAGMMPIMMFIIMFNLNGALAFYYFLSNVITVTQQRIVLRKVDDDIDAATDKAVLKELRGIREAEVVENKKTGTKVTRISAKDIKKKRRWKMNKDESIRFASRYLEDLLSFFGINVAVSSTVDDEVIQLSVPSTSLNSLLIGRGADNLRALQHLVSMALVAKDAELTRVNVDVANYKRQRADRIASKAEGWIAKVRKTGESMEINLNAADRRVVHKVAQDYSDIETHSEGEGRERKLIISKISE